MQIAWRCSVKTAACWHAHALFDRLSQLCLKPANCTHSGHNQSINQCSHCTLSQRTFPTRTPPHTHQSHPTAIRPRLKIHHSPTLPSTPNRMDAAPPSSAHPTHKHLHDSAQHPVATLMTHHTLIIHHTPPGKPPAAASSPQSPSVSAAYTHTPSPPMSVRHWLEFCSPARRTGWNQTGAPKPKSM